MGGTAHLASHGLVHSPLIQSDTFTRADCDGKSVTAYGSLLGKEANAAVTHLPSSTTVQLGPLEVSGVQVAVGLVGLESDQAFLGQNFLSKFDILVQHNQMTLRKRS